MYSHILTLESNPIQISKLEDLTGKIIVKYDINPDKYAAILICLTEAVSNAIVHGNLSNKSKKVVINTDENEDYVSLQVCDEGSGFNFSQLPEPTFPENLEAPGGRGIFVIKALSDVCEFQQPGNIIEMHFKR